MHGTISGDTYTWLVMALLRAKKERKEILGVRACPTWRLIGSKVVGQLSIVVSVEILKRLQAAGAQFRPGDL